MPDGVVARARALLEELESQPPDQRTIKQLDLFGLDTSKNVEETQPEPGRPVVPDPMRELLIGLEPDGLTPRQALDILYRLREMMKQEVVELG
jgi:DNA mismatch repair protein MutS